MREPIPLSLLQSAWDLTEPRPTPTGDAVAWVQRAGRTASIVQVDLDGGPIRLVSHGPDPAPGRGLGGGCFSWVGAEGGLVYVTSAGSLWFQAPGPVGGREISTTEGACRAPVVGGGIGADEVVVYVVDEARVMSTSLVTGATHRLDDGRHAFCFDPAVSPDGSIVSWTAWNPPHMPWDAAVRVDCRLDDGALSVVASADATIQQPRFAVNGARTQVDDRSGWLNVYIDDVAVVPESVEHGGPTWGMGNRSYDVSPDGNLVAFTRNEAGFGSLSIADRRTGGCVTIGRGVHGHLSWLPDGSGVVALRSGARTPNEIVVYRLGADPASSGTADSAASGTGGSEGAPATDVETPAVSGADRRADVGRVDASRSTLAVGPNGNWRRDDLVEPELVEAVATDGSMLFARRYAADAGRMLCWVHGGPTDQWQVEWRPRLEYWRSRGWDVLVVDPRGTTGHGREYQQALHGRWGRLDVDDTADLIRHAHDVGWSTPEHTVVLGGSSGGLTVLGVLADHGELVAGGVASYPVSDLRALTEATHRFEAHYTDTLVAPLDGSASSEQRFADLSPITRADRIAAPLLLFHGTDDPVVPIEQSRMLVDRIRSSNGEVDFIVYDGEGHGFRDPANVADEYERTATFLDRFA